MSDHKSGSVKNSRLAGYEAYAAELSCLPYFAHFISQQILPFEMATQSKSQEICTYGWGSAAAAAL